MRGLFFMHIMKTGGMTLERFLRQHVDPSVVYPPAGFGIGSQRKQQPTHLLEMPPRERERLRLYVVHMPAWVGEAVAPEFRTFTVLRDPVDRTVSHLRQISRYDWVPDDIEAIWDDPQWRLRLANYQTRFLALEGPGAELPEEMKEALRQHLSSSESNLRTMNDLMRTFHATAVSTPSRLDSSDLRRAEQRLRSFDVVGITEDLDRAGARVGALLGFEAPRLGRLNVAHKRGPIPVSLRRRLEEDLALDMELYETARSFAIDNQGCVEPHT